MATSDAASRSVIVALDLGTSFSGYAFAAVAGDQRVFLNYEWDLGA